MCPLSKRLDIDLQYRPREWQQLFHTGSNNTNFALAIVARQHGKTEMAVMELINRALNGPPNVGYGYVCPYMNQTRKVFWDRLKRLLGPLAEYVTFRETDMICTLPNGAKLHGLGGDNEAARGLSLRGLIIDEFDSLNENIWQSVLLPTTASFGDDAFTLFIGTLSRNGKLWDLYKARRDDPSWYVQVTKATDAGLMTEEQLARFRLEMGDSAYMREFLCDPDAPVSNSVVGDLVAQAEIDGRLPHRLPMQGITDVHSSWDIGLRDATSVWMFQLIGREIHIIDYHEFAGIGLIEIANRLNKLRYRWGNAILPHDIAVREFSSGTSRLNTFRELKLGIATPLKRSRIEDTIHDTRANLQRCVFAADKCELGLSRLRQARFAVEAKTGTVMDKIVHDDSSHGLDSFRYLCSWVEKRHPNTGKNAGSSFEQQMEKPKVKRAIRNRRRKVA